MAQRGPAARIDATVQGAPYLPQVQILGEVPSIVPDVPVNVVFLLLFVALFAGHAFIFWRNWIARKKFPLSIMVLIFCLTRIFATSLRIAWACSANSAHLAIAATVCVYGGIILLFLANLFFAQRVVRAQHPRFGWSKPFSIPFPILIVVSIATIICLIAAVIVKFYTLNPRSISAATGAQRYGVIWLAIVATLPAIITGISALARRHPHIKMTKTTDKFGEGSMRTKVAIVIGSSLLLCLGAWFRAGTVLMAPIPVPEVSTEEGSKPGVLSKGCFYFFNFTIEVCVCFLWLVMRADKRFYVPDGAKGPFSYAGGFVFAGESGNEKKRMSTLPTGQSAAGSIHSRISRQSSRISIMSERSRAERVERLENRISWGGVAPDAVKQILSEDGKEPIPYPAVIEGCTAEDVAVDGVEKELGWDPKSGRWAVRPIASVSKPSSRPSSMVISSTGKASSKSPSPASNSQPDLPDLPAAI